MWNACTKLQIGQRAVCHTPQDTMQSGPGTTRTHYSMAQDRTGHSTVWSRTEQSAPRTPEDTMGQQSRHTSHRSCSKFPAIRPQCVLFTFTPRNLYGRQQLSCRRFPELSDLVFFLYLMEPLSRAARKGSSSFR